MVRRADGTGYAGRDPTAQAHADEVRFRIAADSATKRYPAIDPKILTEIADEYIEADRALKQEMRRMERVAPDGTSPNRLQLNRQAGQFNKERYNHIRDTIRQKYGAEGDKAINAVNGELNPSIFRGITDQFYDRGKGGFQLGGMLGGLMGMIGGYFMTGGALNPMSLLTMALTTIGGAWGGNKVGEAMSGHDAAPAATASDSKIPFPTHGKAPEIAQNADISPEVKQQAASHALASGPLAASEATTGISGAFTPSASPTVKLADANKARKTAPNA